MRVTRKQSVADIYHVMSRGNGRQLIYEDDDDMLKFLEICSRVFEECVVEMYAWCLMGNHYHLLVHASLEEVSHAIGRLCSEYARYFNARHDRVGHLFQDRFESEAVNDDAYLLTVVRYIHQNPEKAGIASTDSYLWSSYREYVGTPRLCKTDFVLNVIGGVGQFVSFHHVLGADDSVVEVDMQERKKHSNNHVDAVFVANAVISPLEVGSLKGLDKEARNAAIRALKAAGFSIRQIERLTGIGRNIIQRAG